MEFYYQDKGNYFRGLLILVGKDNKINVKEKSAILEIGDRLGFDHKFSVDAVNELLENKYIDTTAPRFSSTIIAKSFLEEAINLSLVDNDFHIDELLWLQNVSKINEISSDWLDAKIQQLVKNISTKDLEIIEN